MRQFCSEAKLLADEDDMDAPGGAAISRDEDLIADAFLTVAVGTAAGLRARRFAEEALLILRRGDRPGTAHGLVERIDHLVHPGDHDARAGRTRWQQRGFPCRRYSPVLP